jgi:hypothetical protein
MIKAYERIAKARRYLAQAGGATIPLEISLHDIQAYIDLYGCDLDLGLFIECIFAIDGKYMEKALQ